MANWFDLEEEKKPKAWFEPEGKATAPVSTPAWAQPEEIGVFESAIKSVPERWKLQFYGMREKFLTDRAQGLAPDFAGEITKLGERAGMKLPMISLEEQTEENRAKITEIQQKLNAIKPTEEPGYLTGLAAQAVESGLGNTLPGLAAFAITKNPQAGIAVLGGQTFPEYYLSSRERGRTPEQANADATFGALAEGVPELLTFGAMKAAKPFWRKMLSTIYNEAASEMLTEGLNMGYEAGVFGDDITVREAIKRTIDSGLVGAMMGAGAHVATAPFTKEGIGPQKIDEAKLPEWARMPPEPKGEADESGLPPEADQTDVPFEQRELYPTQPSDYTLQTLQLLPAKPVVKRETIEQTLNRQDIKGVEKQLVKEVLETEFAGQQDIDRRAFESRVVEKLPGLSAVDSTHYASYGLARIGYEVPASNVDAAIGSKVDSITRIWSLPYKTSSDTHFGSRTPNYAVHTRSFTDAGVTTRSIVEVQSDVAQRKQVLSKEERITLEEQLLRSVEYIESVKARPISSNALENIAIANSLERETVVQAEIRNKLAQTGPIKNIGEHLYTLAIQEETRKAARDGIQTMRLGTPETVARVEGWEEATEVVGLKKRYERMGKFVKKKYKAQEVIDDKGNTWLEWAVPMSAAVDPVMYYNKSLTDMANQLGRTRTVQDVLAQAKAVRLKPLKAILNDQRSSVIETGVGLVYNRPYESIPVGEATFLGFEEVGDFVEKAKPKIDAWTKRFLPGRRVLVVDEQLMGELRMLSPGMFQSMDRANGRAALLADGTAMIELNTQRYRYLANMEHTYARWMNTLAHEFGHNLAFAEFYKAPEELRFAVLKDVNRIREEMLTGTVEQALARREGIVAFFREVELIPQNEMSMPLVEYLAKHPEIDINYWFSSDELLANQFVKAGIEPAPVVDAVQRFYNRVAALLERFYNYLRDGHFKPSPNYQKFLEHVARSQLQEQQAGGADSIINKLFSDESATQRAERREDIDPIRYNWFIRQFAGLTDLVKLNPQVAPLQAYMTAIRSWWQEKAKWFARADERLHEWQALGKDQSNRLAKLLLDETVEGKWYDMTDQRVIDKYSLGADAVTMYSKIKEDFALVLDVVQQAMVAEAQRSLAATPSALTEEIASITKTFDDMRAKPYFPLPRFGKYTVTMQAHAPIRYQGKNFKLGEKIVSFHESEADARKEEAKLKSELAAEFARKDVLLVTDKIPDSVFSFQGIPPSMLDKLATVLNLDDTQRTELKQYTYALSPASSWRKHMMRRQTVLGFSEDAQRGYAAYMFRAANHLARITHYRQLSQAKSDLNDYTNLLRKKSSVETVKARKLYEHVDRHMSYLMNPESEWEGARAFGFLWYLSAVPKAAFINLAQVPMATYPYLAARYGDTAAVAELAKALDTIRQVHLTPDKVSPDVMRMIEEGKAAGFLDESFASELAAVSEGSTLSRLLPETDAGRRLRQASRIGSFLFHHAEKFNRMWSAIATYELARKAGMDHQKAFETVRTAIESTHFEYSKWDRPELLRGKKSILFLFKRYMIGMLWFLGRDPGNIRALAIIIALAGLQGLPFADDLLDLATWLGTLFKGHHFDARREAREYVKNLGANPDLILHGGMHNFGGFDLSQSLSLGDIVPGTKMLATPGTFKDKLPMAVQEAGGPFVNIPLNLMQMAMDDNPDTWRRVERGLPNFAKDMLQARRFMSDGAVTTPSGKRVVEFDKDNGDVYWYAAGKALGFTPSAASREYEKQRILRDATVYYDARRKALLDAFFLAALRQDREAQADVRRRIRDYNETVRGVEPMLYISGDTISRSVIEKLMNLKQAEAGMAPELRYQHMYGKVNKLFEHGAKEVQSGVNDDKK